MFIVWSVPRWREVPELGARRRVRPVHPDDDPAPGTVALRVSRRIADGVLCRELVRDLAVHAGELAQLAGEERPPSRLLRELTEHEFRFLEPLRRRRRAVVRPEADRVDGCFRSLGEI